MQKVRMVEILARGREKFANLLHAFGVEHQLG
jgi:hypothetical protein